MSLIRWQEETFPDSWQAGMELCFENIAADRTASLKFGVPAVSPGQIEGPHREDGHGIQLRRPPHWVLFGCLFR
jgi:hypothetical protein